MGEIILRNWDLREFGVRVNVPSPIRQVQVPIRHVISPIQNLPKQIGQVVPVICHIRSYLPHCSHHHSPSLFLVHNLTIITEHKVMSSLAISPCYDHELTPSTAYCDHSIHRVQYTLNTASSQDCFSSLQSHDYKLTPQCSFSCQRASQYNQLPSASSGGELKGKVTFCHIPTVASQLTDQYSLSSRRTVYQPPPSTRPILLDHGLQVNLQTRSITACRCIPKLTPSHLPSESPNSHEYGLQVRTIGASKCISKLARLRPPSSLHQGLQVHHQTGSITASECISEFT